MATLPRRIIPGSTFYVTVRAVNRSYRFVPKRWVREVIDYCLAEVSQKYRRAGRIKLYEFMFMSNHYHLLGKDLDGCICEFVRELNVLISRELNSVRGSQDSNFSRKQFGLLEVSGEGRIFEHAVYTLNNPVAAFLTARSQHWKGTSSLKLEYGVPRIVKKPRIGMWSGKAKHAERSASQRSGRAKYAYRSVLPETAELVIDRPPILMHLSDTQLRRHIRKQLAEREADVAEQRRRAGIRVIGPRACQRVHYLAVPRNKEELFARNPTFSADRQRERQRLGRIHAAFVKAYRAARDLYYSLPPDRRHKVEFPEGTYKLRIRDGVTCVPLGVT